MTRNAFIPIVSVSVSHTYFASGQVKGIRYNPGPVTKELGSRYGFILQNQPGGFGIYGNVPSTAAAYLAYIVSSTGYDFFDVEIQVQDDRFYQYTDFPMDETGPLFFSSDDVVLKEGKPVFNLRTGEVSAGQPSGMYRLYFKDILQYGATGFSTLFTARSAQWQYYIVNRSAVKMDHAAVVDKSGVRFEGPSAVTIPTGEEALLFSSGATLIALSETPLHRFDLVNYGNGGNGQVKTIFRGLPNPDPSYLATAAAAGKLAASPMYVYI